MAHTEMNLVLSSLLGQKSQAARKAEEKVMAEELCPRTERKTPYEHPYIAIFRLILTGSPKESVMFLREHS